jgi:3-methyladenine DNA glycosylase AlkD
MAGDFFEEKYLAIEVLGRGIKLHDPELLLARIEAMVDAGDAADWATVDKLGGSVVRHVLTKNPHVLPLIVGWKTGAPHTLSAADSGTDTAADSGVDAGGGGGGGAVSSAGGSDAGGTGAGRGVTKGAESKVWKQRLACVSFVNMVTKPPLAALYGDSVLEVCEEALKNEARFTQLGAGWVLRNLWAVNEEWGEVVEAFLERHLHLTSAEGLRYAIEKMPAPLRASFRQRRKEKLASM